MKFGLRVTYTQRETKGEIEREKQSERNRETKIERQANRLIHIYIYR